MFLLTRGILLAGLVIAAVAAVVAPVSAEDAPHDNIKVRSVAAAWEYSSDGGKTFAKTPQAGPPPGRQPPTPAYPYVWKGTFDVADPANVAALWVRIAEEGDNPRAGICTAGDLIAASGGYWKDLGFCPTLLNASVLLNGKELTFTHGPMLYLWLPIEGELQKGKNTIELRGDVYTYWLAAPAKAIDARLVAAEPQPAKIYNGPLLGDFGDGYFTLACRTQMPAELTVEATPTDPAGKAVSVSSPKKIWHRVKVELPKGTKAVSYTLTAKVGAHVTRRGPFTMSFPGKEFKFLAFGNILAHDIAAERLGLYSQRALAMKPAFILNTGNPSEHGTWEFTWEPRYFAPGGNLLASVPTFITPCWRDFAGAVQELHYTPAEDTYSHNWSKAIGPVRIIGLDGNQTWAVGADNYKWLEAELKNAKEKFLFVLNSYPGYSSGKSSRSLNAWLQQSRNVILPLLGKYKANAMLSGWDPDYERCEPTPDKGCTQIITGAMGKDAYRFSGRAIGSNPFAQGKGREWAGAEGTRHFCVFDVKGETVEMKVLAMPDEPDAKDFPVLDKKTFKAR